jgi:hypothetical protein
LGHVLTRFGFLVFGQLRFRLSVNRPRFLRGPGESYSDVIMRLAAGA